MFLGEEKSASELSFSEHLGTVRGYEFLTTQEGNVSVELGARLGPSPRCPLQFRPARARLGTPVSAKFQNRKQCGCARIWQPPRFLARPLRIWRTDPVVLRAITPSGAENSLAENTGAENDIFFLALYVPERRKTPKSRPPKTLVQKTNSYCC